jgi:hypothetical protein
MTIKLLLPDFLGSDAAASVTSYVSLIYRFDDEETSIGLEVEVSGRLFTGVVVIEVDGVDGAVVLFVVDVLFLAVELVEVDVLVFG